MHDKLINYLIPTIVTLAIFIITKDFPFYWDNVIQISVPANFYFDNNFKSFFLPPDIATGHPTFVGMYLAMVWKLIGRSLMSSHIAMMPFVFGLIYQIFQLIKNLEVKCDWIALGMLLMVLVDTTFLSQLSLITFEVIQLFFFIYCLNQLIENRKISFSICFALLLLISLRGAIIGFGLILSYWALLSKSEKFKIRNYIQFIPGLLGLAGFLIFFYLSNGWVVHNAVSDNWSTSSEYASFSKIIKNMAAMVWQITDYGRILTFGLLAFILCQSVLIRKLQNEKIKYLFIFGLGQLIVLAPILIFTEIPFGHRYFLPVILSFALLVSFWLLVIKEIIVSRWMYCIIILTLISGHFWIYPPKISQGWDSTTLHWRYFEVAEQMNEYIISENVDPKTVGTFFPAYKSRRNTHLEPDDFSYSKYDSSQEYMLYSNAFNVEDAIIESIEERKWEPIKSYESLGVDMSLYRRLK